MSFPTFVIRVIVVLFSFSLTQGQNLFRNPDFEGPFGFDNWFCNGCGSLERSSDAHAGQYSGMVRGRSATWNGATQNLNAELLPGRRYHFSIHVKLLHQDPGAIWHRVDAMLATTYDNGEEVYSPLGFEPYLRLDQGWQRIGGDVYIQNRGVRAHRFYVQLPDVGIDYLVDTARLTEITLDGNWRDQADQRIDQLRKNNIVLNVNLGPHSPANTIVEVRHQKHGFPFGSAVQGFRLTSGGGQNQLYKDFFYNTFDWGVMEWEMKWKQMEREQGQIDYGMADGAIAAMLDRGMKIRAHCMVWGVYDNVPDWLKPMSGEQVDREVQRRIGYAMNHYRGKMEQWDVNNEQLHGSFFEDKTRNVVHMAGIFNAMRAADSQPKLFVNEYAVVSTSEYTYAYLKSVNELKYLNAPIEGIGIQSHLQGQPDIARIKTRLDVMAQAGLPIWITELDIEIADRNSRAQGYEDVLRLYFSHPSIEGIMFWGFWDGAHWRPNAALVEGENLTVNVAGQRVVDLIKNQWMTSADFRPTSQQNRFELRGFHGDYDVVVKVNGGEVRRQGFTLTKGQDITVDVNV